MTEERRQALQKWLDVVRRLAHTIDTPSLTEENVARGMYELCTALDELEPPLARPRPPLSDFGAPLQAPPQGDPEGEGDPEAAGDPEGDPEEAPAAEAGQAARGARPRHRPRKEEG